MSKLDKVAKRWSALLSRLAIALQLCPIWTCNNVQKCFATLSKKGLQKTPKRTSSAKVRIEYASFVSTDIYEPAMLVEDYQNIETIIDKNAVISYLYDYDHTVESSFKEFYKSGGNSIYFNENSNTWRGFMTMLVNQVKDGKIMKLTEQPLMG